MQIRFFFIITFLAAACTPETIPTSNSTLKPSNSIATISGINPTLTQNPLTPFPSIQNLIEKAAEDLALRLSISTAQIYLVEARDVVWPDSSLGCPQPGMAYADVLTPGFLILLKVNGQEYEYHAGKSSNVFYCSNPPPPVENVPDNT